MIDNSSILTMFIFLHRFDKSNQANNIKNTDTEKVGFLFKKITKYRLIILAAATVKSEYTGKYCSLLYYFECFYFLSYKKNKNKWRRLTLKTITKYNAFSTIKL